MNKRFMSSSVAIAGLRVDGYQVWAMLGNAIKASTVQPHAAGAKPEGPTAGQ
jgi:hypothetical protein